ncbi:MAG: GatB/YqeY domain-containing protein [Armatimonadota bacterium]|nr:GatB/YqeY domain-containing protein [bacterium]
MSLIDTLQTDMKQALKNRDELKLSTVRLILSSVSYARIAKGDMLTDDEIVGVISREAKQRRETIESAINGGRADIADREKAELDILQTYLPRQLDEAEIETVVRQIVAEVGAVDIKDRGKIMGPVMQKVRGLADGKIVNAVVEKVLRG